MTGSNVLTPGIFEDAVRTELLIRGVLRYTTNPSPPRITLDLNIFDFMKDRGEKVWSHMSYLDSWGLRGDRPDYYAFTGLRLDYLPPHSRDRHTRLKDMLDLWNEKHQPWTKTGAVVIYAHHERDTAIYPGSFQMMQHFARLETRIAYEMARPNPQNKMSEGMLTHTLLRITALLRNYNWQFQKAMGGVDHGDPSTW